MEAFQLLNLPFDHLYLLLYHRHTTREIVVFAYFASQIFQLRVGHCLLLIQLVIKLPSVAVRRIDNAQQRLAAGNQGDKNGLTHWFLLLN